MPSKLHSGEGLAFWVQLAESGLSTIHGCGLTTVAGRVTIAPRDAPASRGSWTEPECGMGTRSGMAGTHDRGHDFGEFGLHSNFRYSDGRNVGRLQCAPFRPSGRGSNELPARVNRTCTCA